MTSSMAIGEAKKKGAISSQSAKVSVSVPKKGLRKARTRRGAREKERPPRPSTIQRLEKIPMEKSCRSPTGRCRPAAVPRQKGGEGHGLAATKFPGKRERAQVKDNRTATVSAMAMTAMLSAMSRLMTGSVVGRGGRRMMSGSPFSSPKARAGAPSVTKFRREAGWGSREWAGPRAWRER